MKRITAMPLELVDQDKWRKERESCRRHFTAEGVVYHEELAGPDGMAFLLLPDSGHTKADVKKAAERIYRDHDVVHLRVLWLDGEPK